MTIAAHRNPRGSGRVSSGVARTLSAAGDRANPTTTCPIRDGGAIEVTHYLGPPPDRGPIHGPTLVDLVDGWSGLHD